MKITARGAAYGVGLAVMSLYGSGAFADSGVTMYGVIDTFVGSVQTPGTHSAWAVQGGGLSTSYLGFAGSEDLGNGVKAIFTLESYFQPPNGTYGNFPGDAFFSRNANVGLTSVRYGTLRLGRLAPNLFVEAVKFNPFANSFNFSPMMLQTYRSFGTLGVLGATDWNNAVAYMSPNFGGVHVGGIYSFGNEAGAAGIHKNSLVATLDRGHFAAAAVYQYINYSSAAGDIATALPAIEGLSSQSVLMLGASYDFSLVKLYGEYMHTHNSAQTENVNVDTAQVGVSVPVGRGSVLGSYAYSTASSGDRRNTFALGYDYPVSKRTELYALVKSDHVGGDTTGNSFGVGIRTKF